MKKLLVVLFFVLFGGTALAHPPASQEIKYNRETGVLEVATVHGVQDPKSHYIVKYIVSVDGKEVKDASLTEQTNAEKEVISIQLPGVNKGSVIAVKAECNKFGQLETSITVE